MKRTIVWLLGLVAMLASSFAFANAIASNVAGSVSAITTAGVSHVVREGDSLKQGYTVVTGASSSVVLKFEDGQIAALGANSRMVITRYEFDSQKQSGNILLSLVSGGMRAITGILGRAQPKNVTYRAGNYTIGIRGTDVFIAVNGANVAVTVETGEITFTVGNRTITVTAGQGVVIGPDGQPRVDVVTAIVQYLQANDQTLLNNLNGPRNIDIPAGIIPGPGGVGGAQSVTVTPTPGGGGSASPSGRP